MNYQENSVQFRPSDRYKVETREDVDRANTQPTERFSIESTTDSLEDRIKAELQPIGVDYGPVVEYFDNRSSGDTGGNRGTGDGPIKEYLYQPTLKPGAELQEDWNIHAKKLKTLSSDEIEAIKVSESWGIPTATSMAILRFDNSHDIRSHLATHPEDAAVLASMTPAQAKTAVKHISDTLKGR